VKPCRQPPTFAYPTRGLHVNLNSSKKRCVGYLAAARGGWDDWLQGSAEVCPDCGSLRAEVHKLPQQANSGIINLTRAGQRGSPDLHGCEMRSRMYD